MKNITLTASAGALGFLLMVPALAIGQNCIHLDDFNDNSQSASWMNFSTDGVRLQCVEQNNRLEFPSPVENPGLTLFSGVVSNGWKIDMQKDWAVSFRYHLMFNPPTNGGARTGGTLRDT